MNSRTCWILALVILLCAKNGIALAAAKCTSVAEAAPTAAYESEAMVGAASAQVGSESDSVKPQPLPRHPFAADNLEEAYALLKRSHMIMEPALQIQTVVKHLDNHLDTLPSDAQAYAKLAEALAFGYASSRHAASPAAALRRALALDPANCHLGAWLVEWESDAVRPKLLDSLLRKFPKCPELIYLEAVLTNPQPSRKVELLASSAQIQAAGETLVALGQAYIALDSLGRAVESFERAATAAPLFPEEWRPDIWIKVHSKIGLAWAKYRLKQLDSAKEHYQLVVDILSEPGPWHDQSAAEEAWMTELGQQWPEVRPAWQK